MQDKLKTHTQVPKSGNVWVSLLVWVYDFLNCVFLILCACVCVFFSGQLSTELYQSLCNTAIHITHTLTLVTSACHSNVRKWHIMFQLQILQFACIEQPVWTSVCTCKLNRICMALEYNKHKLFNTGPHWLSVYGQKQTKTFF